MTGFIYLSAVVLICNEVLIILGTMLDVRLFNQKPLIKKYLPIIFMEIGILGCIDILIHKFASTSQQTILGFPEIAAFVLSATAGSLLISTTIYPKWDKCIRMCSLAALVPFVLEITLFNGSSYFPLSHKMNEQSLSIANAQSLGDVTIADNKNSITVGNKGGLLTFTGIDSSINTVYFKMSGSNTMDKLSIKVKSEGNADSFITVKTKRFTPASSEEYFSVDTGGKIKELQISFNESRTSFTLNSIMINKKRPFCFSLLRYFSLALLFCTLILIREKRLWNIEYQPLSFKQNTALIVSITVCMMMSVSFLRLPSESVDYPLKNKPDQYNPYIQQFDAFQKGQLNLDVEVNQKLQTMENPYDLSARVARGVGVQWDRAYYNGKYYSYFGVVPIFTIYYPYYFLTGKLPSDVFVCTILAVLSIAFLFLLLLTLVKLFCKPVNLLLLLLGLVSAVLSSGVLIAQSCSDFYYIAILSAVCSGFMFLFFSFYAYQHVHSKTGWIHFILAGISYVMLISSRPVDALLGLVVVPIFLYILLNRDLLFRQKISCALSFLIPVFIGSAAIMIYNAKRFSSPFDFGAAYQLTVSDISKNTVRLKSFVPSLIHYFFQPLQISAEFPFLKPTYYDFGTYGHYLYIASSVGAFAYPAVLSVGTLPAVMLCSKHAVKKYTYFCMGIAAVFIAFLTFSLGGVNIRYTADIMPVLSILSVLLLLECHNQIGRDERIRGFSWALSALLLCGSGIVGTALVFSNERDFIVQKFPQFILYLEKLFIFWA